MYTNYTLQAALEYALKGWDVFPVKGGEKAPLIPGGFKNATTDAEQIKQWWLQPRR